MFYEASELDNFLICNLCHQKLNDPRVLPCGQTFCNRCIEAVADTDKKRIKCQHCNKIHEIPLEGFPENPALNGLVQLKSNEVFRGLLVNDLKKISETIKDKTSKIELDLEIGATLIRNQCDKVRDHVQLVIEEAHVKLEDMKKMFLDDIDEYEKECQEQFKQIQQNKTKIDQILIESKEVLKKSETLFKQFDVKEQDVKKSLDEANKLLDSLEIVEDKLHSDMFKGINLKFEKNIKGLQAKSIGRLERQNLDFLFLDNLFTNAKEIDFTNKFDDLGENRFFWCHPFKNSHFIGGYINQNKNFNLTLFDKEANIRVEKRDVIVYSTFQKLINFDAYSSKNIIYVLTQEKYSDNEEIQQFLRSFDENLNLISMLKLDFSPLESSYSFDGMLFLGQHEAEENGFFTLICYNSKLEVIQKYGQSDPTLPFYFPLELTYRILINEKHFLLINTLPESADNDHDKITLINKISGINEHSFYLEYFDQAILYLDKYILLHRYNYGERDSSDMFCHDLEGNFIKKTTFKKDLEIAFSLKKRLYLLKDLDQELKVIYV